MSDQPVIFMTGGAGGGSGGFTTTSSQTIFMSNGGVTTTMQPSPPSGEGCPNCGTMDKIVVSDDLWSCDGCGWEG